MRVTVSIIALFAMSAAANAQDRTRSGNFTGGEQACETWDVGFEFEECRRIAFPGDEAEYVQVYKRTDGSRVNFIADPKVGSTAPTSVGGGAGDVTVIPATSVVPAAAAATTSTPNTPLPKTITIVPGRTELIPVAVGHLNRIETPFGVPAIRTSGSEDALNVEFDGRFIYFSVTEAVTVYIHEKGYPDPVIAVSLIPRKIAPRQVELRVPPPQQRMIDANKAVVARAATGDAPTPVASRPGIKFGSGVPHVQAAATILQQFALGNIPRGFKKGTAANYNIKDFCRVNTGVSFSFGNGQVYYDNTYILLIGRASSNSRRQLQENWCAAHPATAAVSFYPRPVISKGKPTEFFVLLRRDVAERKGPSRKRLVE